jgi:hypothetical protein
VCLIIQFSHLNASDALEQMAWPGTFRYHRGWYRDVWCKTERQQRGSCYLYTTVSPRSGNDAVAHGF